MDEFDPREGIGELHEAGLLSEWTVRECAAALRRQLGMGIAAEIPPLRARDFELLLADYYRIGLTPRSRRDRFVALGFSGGIGYKIEPPLVRALCSFADDAEFVRLDRQTDHMGTLIGKTGERFRYDLVDGLHTIAAAFNCALAAAGRVDVVYPVPSLANRGPGCVGAWLVRERAATGGPLLSRWFGARSARSRPRRRHQEPCRSHYLQPPATARR